MGSFMALETSQHLLETVHSRAPPSETGGEKSSAEPMKMWVRGWEISRQVAKVFVLLIYFFNGADTLAASRDSGARAADGRREK